MGLYGPVPWWHVVSALVAAGLLLRSIWRKDTMTDDIKKLWDDRKTRMRKAMYDGHVYDCENNRRHYGVAPLDWHTFKFRVWPDFHQYVVRDGTMPQRRVMQCLQCAFNMAERIQRKRQAV